MIGIFEARPPMLRFERQAVPDIEATREAGRTMTKNVNVVHITQPPGKDCVTRNAEKWLAQCKEDLMQGRRSAFPPEWVDGFHRAYKNWQEGVEGNVAEGETSLRDIPFVSPAEVENYAGIHIYTVEAAASMTEDALKSAGMGARAFRDKCRAYLEAANDGGKVAEEVAHLKQQLQIRDGEIAALVKRLDALESDKPKRGRPSLKEAA